METALVRMTEGPINQTDSEGPRRRRLALVHDLPVGGAKRHISAMLDLLAEQFDVTVFEFDRPDRTVCEIGPGTTSRKAVFPAPPYSLRFLSKVPVAGQMAMDLALSAYYRPIADAVNRGGFDATFVTQSRITNTPPLLAMLETPIIYGCQEPTRVLYEPYRVRAESPIRKSLRVLHNWVTHPFLRRRERRLVQRAHALVANSSYSAEVLDRLFERKAVVAYPGVHGEIFKYARAASPKGVLSVGSLDIVKGHDFVIECVARVPREHRPSLTIICPRGTHSTDEALYLERMARARDVAVEIVSGISDDELAARYANAIALLFAARLEPFGLVCIEAMACGCPVLTVEEGGPRETVIDGVTGFVLPRDPDSFAQRLLQLIQDVELRHRLGANGARHVREQFTWKRNASDTAVAIAQALPSPMIDAR
jgi:glycosyltransferase involved in cell wall biosynthesis